jgi:hypothetical protein
MFSDDTMSKPYCPAADEASQHYVGEHSVSYDEDLIWACDFGWSLIKEVVHHLIATARFLLLARLN